MTPHSAVPSLAVENIMSAAQIQRATEWSARVLDDAQHLRTMLKHWHLAREKHTLPALSHPSAEEQRVIDNLREVDRALSSLQERIAETMGSCTVYRLGTGYSEPDEGAA